jgi:hypothetical protein
MKIQFRLIAPRVSLWLSSKFVIASKGAEGGYAQYRSRGLTFHSR